MATYFIKRKCDFPQMANYYKKSQLLKAQLTTIPRKIADTMHVKYSVRRFRLNGYLVGSLLRISDALSPLSFDPALISTSKVDLSFCILNSKFSDIELMI